METFNPFQIVLLLLLCSGILAVIAERLRVAYPIALVIGGLIVAAVPGLPEVTLEPHIVFELFLPPLLFVAAFWVPWDDALRFLRPILMLGLGLTIITVFAVGYGMHWAIDMALPAALVLGAVVSPPDAVAAVAVMRGASVPHGTRTVLEGESLINDAAGLTALKLAIGLLAADRVTFGDAAWELAYSGLMGAAFGAGVGWIATHIHRRVPDPSTVIMMTLLTPYFAYLPAEKLGLSGVLAAVSAGLVNGALAAKTYNPMVRLRAASVWEVFEFLLNSLVFIVIGLQLPGILRQLREADITTADLMVATATLSAIVIGVRFLWVFSTARVATLYPARWRRRASIPTWRGMTVVSWCGMRGIVTLAAALSLPVELWNGTPFLERPLILFLAFAIILVTLLLQGLTLPVIIRMVGLSGDDSGEEELEARRLAYQAALDRLHRFGAEPDIDHAALEGVKKRYMHQLRLMDASDPTTGLVEADLAFSQAGLEAERQLVQDLRRRKVISDAVFRRLQRDIDLREVRLLERGA